MLKSFKLRASRLAPTLLCAALMSSGLYAWGPKGHEWVTEKAVDCLQGKLKDYLGKHRSELIRRSMDPDYRKERDPEEGFRHYIDLDRYGDYPFPHLDLDYPALVQKFGAETVKKNGTLLWAGTDTFESLVSAFREREEKRILLYASDLAHYVADLHQPFHTAENYNGQLTGQTGIHFRFEDDLLNLYLDKVPASPAPPRDLGPVLKALRQIALESFLGVETILRADRQIVNRLNIDRSLYRSTKEEKKWYPDPYYSMLFEELGPLIRKRLNEAAVALASFWWMAWNQAGRPAF